MRAYCERQVVDYQSVVFSYDGQRLREDQTPGEVRRFKDRAFLSSSGRPSRILGHRWTVLQLEMEDNDYIDVLQHQVRPLKARTTQSNDNYVKKVARSLVELLSLRNEVQVGGM